MSVHQDYNPWQTISRLRGEIERLTVERDEARETIRSLNRRCQTAEGLVERAGLVEKRPQGAHGRSMGRALANYAAEQYRRELVEARADNARLREALGVIAGIEGEAVLDSASTEKTQ